MKADSKPAIWLVPLAFAIYILINKLYFAEVYHFLMDYTDAVLAYFVAYLLVGFALFITVVVLFEAVVRGFRHVAIFAERFWLGIIVYPSHVRWLCYSV